MQRVLITGGAGFIGSHLADRLIGEGYRVRILDNLTPQVHGAARERPSYLNERAELIVGDVRDGAALERALEGVEAVFHLAASVGVGQSMYEIEGYVSNNSYGTGVLCQCIKGHRSVRKLIVASSMSIYGEGMYVDAEGKEVSGARRSVEQLKEGDWEVCDSRGRPLKAIATPESKRADLSSIYALTKYDQERMCLITGQSYGIATIALRFFNVFGTRQALSNPYTGVLAIFASRLLNGNPPLVFEDGQQKRDFVSVHDVVSACMLALSKRDVQHDVFNIGSGQSYTIVEVARMLGEVLGSELEPLVTSRSRAGDIRHCFADISRARDILGYSPRTTLRQGLGELTEWLQKQQAHDRVEEANSILDKLGLTI